LEHELMPSDWWPQPLQFIPKETPWAEGKVPAARLLSVPNGDGQPGEFRSFSVLVPMADLEAVKAFPRGLHHEVSASGPHPWEGAASTYDPVFWVDATGLPSERYEPLILSWSSNNQTVLLPDPRFLMTYGLVPRALSKGRMSYDDPQSPVFDVVQVDPPSIWDSPSRSTSMAMISRDYLQDYLTLRGAALFEVYYAMARGALDQECLDRMGGQQNVDIEFPDRTISLIHQPYHGDDALTAQVWGARLIAWPNDLPITADPLQVTGLNWPGYQSPINAHDAAKLGVGDYVYVDDRVLAPYEGKPGFVIHPESGSVSFGNQWSVGFCDRVGRNTIRLELKKLYEGAPASAIRNWHEHAVAPTAAILSQDARNEANIGGRAKDLVLAWSDIGAALTSLAGQLGIQGSTAESFVKLDRQKLDYSGWWAPTSVEPIARHVPIDMDQASFLQRCVALNNLLTEGVGQAAVRKVLDALGVPEREHKTWKGLKMLNEVVCLAQVSHATGLSLVKDASMVRDELKAKGTEPARPLENLFALYDLRIVGAHSSTDPTQELENRLDRFGIEKGDYAGGFGRAMDQVYDRLAAELLSVAGVLAHI
jgi:hypothetical protein